MRYLILKNNLVVNAIDWDGDTSKWQPPEGVQLLQSEQGSPGDTWDGQKFVSPVWSPEYYTPAQIDAYIDGITSLAKLRTFLKQLTKYMVVKV